MLCAATVAALVLPVLLLVPAGAQQPELAEPAASSSASAPAAVDGLELSADLRSAYLSGRKVLITLRASNTGSQPLEMPRLDMRPHLVSFELINAAGKKTTRRNAAPEVDEDLRWVIPVRGSRQVTLEVPFGGALEPGRYQLAIGVDLGEQVLELGPASVLLERPAPAAADVTDAGKSTISWQVPWVHAGSEGHELYLHSAPGKRPDARGYEWHLTDLDQPVEPLLAQGRTADGANRHIYWRTAEQDLAYARLEERKLRHDPRRISLPYPRWELLARAGGDASGGLHLPVWVPAPSGDDGEVRVVSIDDRGQPVFRRVAAMSAKPQAVSWVDSAGRLRLLLHHGGMLDFYTLDTTTGDDRPASGLRLLPQTVRADEVQLLARPVPPERSPVPGAIVSDRIAGFIDQRLVAMSPPPVLGVRFGTLPDTPDEAGGTAIFAWMGDPGVEPLGLSGVWLSVKGRVIATVPGVALPAGHRIAAVLPRGYQPWVLHSIDRRGVSWARSAAWEAPVELGALGPHDALRLDAQGRLWLVRLVDGQGVVVEPVQASERAEPEPTPEPAP